MPNYRKKNGQFIFCLIFMCSSPLKKIFYSKTCFTHFLSFLFQFFLNSIIDQLAKVLKFGNCRKFSIFIKSICQFSISIYTSSVWAKTNVLSKNRVKRNVLDRCLCVCLERKKKKKKGIYCHHKTTVGEGEDDEDEDEKTQREWERRTRNSVCEPNDW
ncbi:uncharacterized protein CELE_Y24D9A.6 [Caenorhabditis elegans]|uniref:Uncharacterized protein n=1 Tax=Caenorhabditis elegans TaxID=6239 RepID=Q9N556_CAEEL|nr:Uncharacterized protein CELE_Y24D9A.6 [Caenorhabditis elegans]CCD71901.1 Uncharacterized protein CELE_Y24D9A.6 [Caenorhabditis elegans]|eukprot:NP_500557.1 Uncharacterized protein CELE_Y24D9A.6 [Caenorhabditis elegans]